SWNGPAFARAMTAWRRTCDDIAMKRTPINDYRPSPALSEAVADLLTARERRRRNGSVKPVATGELGGLPPGKGGGGLPGRDDTNRGDADAVASGQEDAFE